MPQQTVASIMGFGSGVLISALAFNLMDEAYKRGAFWATVAGFLGDAISLVTMIAIFLSDIPESLSSASGMKKAGRSAGYVFSVGAPFR